MLMLSRQIFASRNYSHAENFPTANSEKNRVMGFILAFSYDHIDPLILILTEYVSMCEGGWDPTVVLFTTVQWTPAMFRYIRQKTYCYRTNAAIKVRTEVHPKDVGTALAAKHRPYLEKELNNSDVFIYHEDDIIFKYSHLSAYLAETKKLNELSPETGLYDYSIGFQRYRRIYRDNIHGGYGENDIFEQELFEEMPTFSPICIQDTPYFHVGGNTHQAIWIFTRTQIDMLIDKCSFLGMSSASRYNIDNNYIFFTLYSDINITYCS